MKNYLIQTIKKNVSIVCPNIKRSSLLPEQLRTGQFHKSIWTLKSNKCSNLTSANRVSDKIVFN